MERGLLLAVAASGEGLWCWSLVTDELFWSERMLDMLGLVGEPPVATSARFFDRLHPDDHAAVEDAVRAHLRCRVPYDCMMRLRAADGRYRTFRARGQAEWDDARGQPVRMVGAMADLTEQLRDRLALEASERRFADMAANIPGAIFRFILRPDGSSAVEYMSPGCVDLWEVPDGAIREDAAILWDVIDPDDLPAMRRSVLESARTLQPWSHRWRITTPSGRRKWLLGRGSPQLLPDGVVLWNSLVLDVTDQALAELELQAARTAAEASSRAKSHFLSTISHELRTPLNGVTGMAALLAASTLDARQRLMLEVLRSSAETLTAVLNDVIEASRMEAGPIELDRAPFALPELLRQAAAAVAPRIDPARVTLTVACDPPDPPALVGDGPRIARILSCLLDNAAKFTPDGAIALQATVQPAEGQGAAVRLTVRDTGVGVPPDQADTIFEPFSQADQSDTRLFQGTGLGLSLARRFARAMGGDVAYAPAADGGSVFAVTLTLPCARAEDAAPPPQAARARDA
jgi:signal transduction histidine kinase